MGGGTLWRSVARAVGAAAAPTAVVTATAVQCASCSAGPPTTSSRACAAAACNCKATTGQAHPGLTAVSYGPRQFWDLDDWEIAGDEERDHYVFGSLPTLKEVEEASSDLQNALRLGFFTPPVSKTETFPEAGSSSARSSSPASPRGPTIVEVTEVSAVTTIGDLEDEVTSDLTAPTSPEAWIEPPPYEVADSPRDVAPASSEVEAWLEPPSNEVATSPKAPEAPSSAMLEAFHQFQHNPQVQGMVVSLATDQGVWDAVLANEKIKEFRRNFTAPTSEDSLGGGMDQKVKSYRKNTNVFSRLFWKSKKAFADFISNFQDFVTSLFETAEKKGPGSSNNEKTNFFERSVKACMMLAVLVLAIVVFKRSAAVRRG